MMSVHITQNPQLIIVTLTGPIVASQNSTVSKTLMRGTMEVTPARANLRVPSHLLVRSEMAALSNYIGDMIDAQCQLDALVAEAADFRRKIINVGEGGEIILQYEE